jgi:hypothetical protein
MASVLKSAGEFRRRVVVKSPMRRRFKIRQEIGANNFLNEVVFFAPSRGVDAGQPPQDIRDSSRARPFTLTPRITKKTRQATSSTTFCFVHADRSTSAQPRVTGNGRLEVQFADDLAELLRARHHRADMWLALGLVAVEQRITGLAAQHELQLPGEVGRVTDAGAEALSKERRRLMHGIAHQEHAPIAPALCEQCVEAIDGRTPDREVGNVRKTFPICDDMADTIPRETRG